MVALPNNRVPAEPWRSRQVTLEARVERLEADIAAYSADRRWIVSVLAHLAVDAETGGAT